MEIIELILETTQYLKQVDKKIANEYLAAAFEYYYTGSWTAEDPIVKAAMIQTKKNIDFYKKI